mmetsp:Transcript_3154/g.3678  ORF Transcript_3154/g.3678 Transcript_3154/m.3678 type:complete len:168 (+) Transcript_3154:115-618(+)
MARHKTSASVFVIAAVAIMAVAMLASTAFAALPVRQCTVQPPLSPLEAPPAPGSAAMAGAVASLVGLALGFLTGPQMASAGVARSLPDFSLVRPDYMQGIDASNAAKRPGEVDYVTRSHIEALLLPIAAEELKVESQKFDASPSRADRVEKLMRQLRELAPEADIPA